MTVKLKDIKLFLLILSVGIFSFVGIPMILTLLLAMHEEGYTEQRAQEEERRLGAARACSNMCRDAGMASSELHWESSHRAQCHCGDSTDTQEQEVPKE